MRRQNFDREWLFHLGRPQREPEPSAWRLVDLPHDWSIELDRTPDAPSQASGGYFRMGAGRYRKTFHAPQAWAGKCVFIEFEGVYMNAEVRLNGNVLGRHPYGYTSFHYDLTPYLVLGAENVLQVTVDNAAEPNSRWYSGSGIYRHVWLMVAEPVHVDPWGVFVTTPQVSSEKAVVEVETMLANDGTDARTVTLLSHAVTPEGVVVASVETQVTLEAGKTRSVVQELTLSEPRLWRLDMPDLYDLETEVAVEGEEGLIDAATTTFGVRTLSFDAQHGFLLNGEPTLLRGGCVHHDDGVMGAASYDRAEERKVEVLKASGFNAIRCAHNPPAPAFLDACDRLGMLVIDEAFDCWREGKNPYDYHVAFADWWQRDLDSMVRRDRNHPSVIVWSIGNEVGERDGSSDGVAWAHRLADRVRELDPTRPVTAAVNGLGAGREDDWPETDPVFAALDIGGYNYQERHYRSDHERHPDRVMMGTESTAGEALEHWAAVEELPYVIGDFVWTSLDYLGEAGIGRVHYEEPFVHFLGEYPWNQANCGDLDLCGFKRPQSHYRDVLWGTGSKLYLVVHDPGLHPEGKAPKLTYWGWPEAWPNWTWPGHEGETFNVDVYSACDTVELWLNGESLGSKQTDRASRHIASFEVPYEPGTLEAAGFVGGKKVAMWQIQTVGRPVGLRLLPDRDVLEARPDDLSFVTVEVIDKMERVHPSASPTIYFTVAGEGALAAVGNGNPASEESYRGHARRAYHGRCLVVVKASGEPGTITLRAQADGLAAEEVTLQVVA